MWVIGGSGSWRARILTTIDHGRGPAASRPSPLTTHSPSVSLNPRALRGCTHHLVISKLGLRRSWRTMSVKVVASMACNWAERFSDICDSSPKYHLVGWVVSDPEQAIRVRDLE